ncbi:Cytoskeleton-associated protein 5 [Phytophthora cactorum]|uniref:Cytoskeleton-associated protein 5 n=1 Tax=Phytophthora cactorum TaxID=29920 RepID=A0A329SJM8_9STRA|nr:Cytoskeleton-associated protein 5 [Phytophthora cactorum]KAG2833461.1 Cytoskeleton-associated protein 5 [Phytophthora cactorum]KAG2836014.1 Cytoskeleton-associated protein 5 [Phytophthora cactorum]KAG2862104.1 Cytoskeleton-associated protein 5 [Phytophthora cactorum]KAG2903524.1 Cytoskeleton-associated protein 5 [Phytophthora cactorum]
MAEKCLRNASCKCSMCAGFDVASLMSISKSISSNIQYGDGEEEEAAPPPPKFGGMVNSPPVPSQKKSAVANSPPVRASKRPPQTPTAAQNVHMDAPMEDVSMADAGAQDIAMEPSSTMKDTQMESVASTLSNMEVDSPADTGAQGGAVSIDAVLPKLTDKNWKVRKEGFEELKTLFEQPGVKTNQARPVMELFKKMCEDTNASAMEAGIAAVLAYTLNVEPFDKEIVSGVMARVTDKGFSARPGIVKLCTELTDAFIAAGAAEETVTALLEGTNNRKPKVPPACATSILDALKEYGPRVVPLQAIKTALPKLMEGAVKVRPIAMSIMVEIHRWTGPALVQDIVANLRQAQQTEFEEQTKDVAPGQAAPTKFVRGAKPAKAAGGAAGKVSSGASSAAEPAAPAFDPRDFAETVDLLAKLPKSEFKAKLALPKWSEKVEALKIVLELIGPIPKLANGDYYELVSTLKALTNDSNVNIVAKSIEVFGALADGLRKNFTQYARMMFPELLRKLSDKKSVILNATNKTLDLFLQHAMTIDMMMDDLKLACDASKNKAPPARVQTMAFLTRAVENRYVDLNDKALIVAFGAMFMKGIDDTDPKVREAGQKCFVVLLQATDQTAGWLQSMMDEIGRKNPRAFKTIQKGLGGAALTTSSRPGSAQSSRPGSAASRPGSAPPSRPGSAGSAASRSSFGGSKASEPDVDVDMDSSPAPAGLRRPSLKKRGPPTRLGTKPGTAAGAPSKAAPSRKPPAAGSSTGPSAGGGASTDFTPISVSVTAEEAEYIIAELQLDNWSSIQEGFASSKWMERKGALEGLEEYARANSSLMSVRVIEAFTMYLSKQVKDFKDSNINVLKSAFQAVGTFAETAASKFPRGVVCLVTPRACDKIGDRKANEAVRTMIMQFCEATSPAYTTGCMIECMPKVRLPLAHIEALSVLSDCVKDFGISICNPRALIDYAKGPQGLEGSNPKVRSAATSLLSTMYSQLGPALLPILNLESWKPALAKTVEDEFKKVGFNPAKAMATIKRQVKDQDEAPAAADPGALFGRVDVSSQITKELLEDMKNEKDKVAWKKRAEAMDSVQAICEGAGCAIEFTRPVQEVLRNLKARLNDSNANLKVKAANVIAVVATSVGPDIAKMSKILGASLIAGVADNKKTMQAAAVQALHKWVSHNNETSSACMESLLSPLSEGLINTVGRAELLGWAAEHLQNCGKLDLYCLVAPTVQCMMDKSSEAREKAQLVLVEVMKSVGKDVVFTTGCRDIKPAAMRALKPLLQKVSDAVEASGGFTASEATTSIPAPSAAPPVAPSAAGNSGVERGGLKRRASASAGSTPVKSRLARPGSLRAPMTSSASQSETSAQAAPLLKMTTNKPARLSKGQFNKWIFETTSTSEMNARKGEIEAEWKPFLSPEFHAKLFAPSLEKGMLAAMDELTLCIIHQGDEVISSLDLVLKWCTLRIVDNNVQALAKLLEVLVKLFEMLKDTGYQLEDVEAAILLPYLLQESGQSKPRFRVRFRDVMKVVVDVYNPEKYVPYLMECFNGSKNMKSRCECIDLVEYIVSVHGYQVIGRKCIKDVGKYVVAHEKELRESAINALVAVYKRTEGGNPDKFFRFAGITTQQGIDLLNARLKHLPANSFQSEAPAPAQQEALEREAPQLQRPQRTGFGFGFGRAAATATTAPTNIFTSSTDAVREQPVVEPTGVQQFNTEAHDVDMSTPENEAAEEESQSAVIEELLLRPIEMLINSSKEIVPAGTSAYKEGGNALKGLYAIINRPSDPCEVEFLHSYVNEIVLALCDCIHGAFYAGNAEKRPEMYILAISITTLTVVFNSDAVTSMQRYTVERVLLELCSKIMDPRMEKFSEKANLPVAEIALLPPEEKRYLMVFKALYKAMRKLTERAKPGDVYPSVINLLQRLMHNDVGDYNKNDTLKHLLKEDSLDQLVGRILLKLSNVQSNSLTPFEGIDIFGVLMQMHMFFSTLPGAEVMMVDIANDNMRSALKIMAESLMKTRSSAFEASMKDVPPTSPVRQALEEMGIGQSQQKEAVEPAALRYGENGTTSNDTSISLASAAPRRITTHFGATNGVAAAPEESLTRRLFPPRDSGIATRTTRTASAAPSLAETMVSADSRGRSFTSFHDFAANRGAAATNASRPSTTSAQLESLRERLQMSRHFNQDGDS